MKKVSSFVISGFTNPSGEIVYPIYGRIEGPRIRKNFGRSLRRKPSATHSK